MGTGNQLMINAESQTILIALNHGLFAKIDLADYPKLCFGSFADVITAARVADIVAKAQWGEFARLNFPDATGPLFPMDDA
jgi:hypothetical protein